MTLMRMNDINKFVAKLTGSNKGKRRYAEATNYAKVLTGYIRVFLKVRMYDY